MKILNIVSLSVFLFFSCAKEVKLDLLKELDKVVIEANINNLEPIYVRLTRPTNEQIIAGSQLDPTQKGIDNAKIIIRDNTGNAQILKKYFYNNQFNGYYFLPGYYGVPGRTYFLEVEVQGKKYSASSIMPEIAQIDSLNIKFVEAQPGKSDLYLPQIFFKDDTLSKNYYLLKYCNKISENLPFYDYGLNCSISNRVWNYTILDDRFFKSYVNGLELGVGQSPNKLYVQALQPNTPYNVYLYQLNKEAFQYYQDLIDQINSDGGAYQPSPTSARTNFSGGAIGFFAAMAVSTKPFKIVEKKK